MISFRAVAPWVFIGVIVLFAAVFFGPPKVLLDAAPEFVATAPLGNFESLLWAHDGRAAVYVGATVAVVEWESVTGVIPHGSPVTLATDEAGDQYLIVQGYVWPVVGERVKLKDY